MVEIFNFSKETAFHCCLAGDGVFNPDFRFLITDEKTNYFNSQIANIHSAGTADISEEVEVYVSLKAKYFENPKLIKAMIKVVIKSAPIGWECKTS
ncbi:hypothetical protein [Coxiella-like endosymbiont]|uniref:hypothetical protein n=1 Tax=Coxiella-like endosymbiont TaxID=1592897 RepID=UPI002729DF96|nr:hypothetical protein [Coxiella-like endosymbiont]